VLTHFAHTCKHTNTHIRTHTHMHTHTRTHTCAHTRTHKTCHPATLTCCLNRWSRRYTVAHTYTHIHIHIHTYTHIHIHTHNLLLETTALRHTTSHTHTHKHTHIQVIAGNNNPDMLPEEVEWEGRKERMAQMEAVLMSAIHHPNIVNTYKVGVFCFPV